MMRCYTDETRSSGVETRRILGSVVKMQAGYYQTIKLLNLSIKKTI